MCCQAYDFVELNSRFGCTLQMGGSDQWGNIVMGVDLGRRLGSSQLQALTSPLITTASGAKMGKTAAGAVWLDPAMLSPYDYWQFWRNTEDSDVGRFLKLFTLLPLDEIAFLSALRGAEINEAKKVLADAATTLLHGPEAAEAASATARKTFELRALASDLPTVDVPAAEFEAGYGVLRAFLLAKLVGSTGEARRQIRGGGLDRKRESNDRPRRAAGRRPGEIVAGTEEARAAEGGVALKAARRDSLATIYLT
jgi:tyrosyl-tRNA synthetase